MSEQAATLNITDIRCPKCGAPAKFDILTQNYRCGYCGEQVEIKDAKLQVQGFRKIRGEKLKQDLPNFRLGSASCSGCGATVVFEENEALSTCAFCGSSLVRRDYLEAENLPESVIPFAITEEEAKNCLAQWCADNRSKREAKHLKPLLHRLRGCYLPYELVYGPVHMQVSRMDGGSVYNCEGFLNGEYVNRSRQLDNLLLDGMEPFETGALAPFDFACVAGHPVKIADVSEEALEQRVKEEANASCTPVVRSVLESKAVEVNADVSSAIRLPVLLPVYYIAEKNLMAAVNGQTGKVSVRAEKESHYYFLPWWLKAVIATLVASAVTFGALCLFGMAWNESLFVTGLAAIVWLIVMLCLYSDTTKNRFAVEAGREIFTSGEKTFHRVDGELVKNESILRRRTAEPVFFETIDGKTQPVVLKFSTPLRVLKMVVISLVVLFLPVIIALFLNGFDFERLELGGSAVWFCIMVPVLPVYIAKFGIVELYERPWIYIREKDGKLKRYRGKSGFHIDKELIKTILAALIVPPICFAVWLGILVFGMMCWLTAFGFGS